MRYLQDMSVLWICLQVDEVSIYLLEKIATK